MPSNEMITQHYTPAKTTPERVSEIIAAIQAGIYPYPVMEIQNPKTGKTATIIPSGLDEALGVVDFLATEIAVERGARQVRDAQIIQLTAQIQDLKRALAKYEPEACS